MSGFSVPRFDFRMPEMPKITPMHVQEAERFRDSFQEIKRGLTELLKPNEELALYYFTGMEDIRVYHVQMMKDTLVLLYGYDSSRNYTCALVRVGEVKLVFKRLKLDEKKERTPIGFSLGNDAEEAGNKPTHTP
jgi:hypothetical protein